MQDGVMVTNTQLQNQTAQRIIKNPDGTIDYSTLEINGVEFVSVSILEQIRLDDITNVSTYFKEQITEKDSLLSECKKEHNRLEQEIEEVIEQLSNLRKYSSIVSPYIVLLQLYKGGNVGIDRKLAPQREFKIVKYRANNEVQEWIHKFDEWELLFFIGNERWAKYTYSQCKTILTDKITKLQSTKKTIQ